MEGPKVTSEWAQEKPIAWISHDSNVPRTLSLLNSFQPTSSHPPILNDSYVAEISPASSWEEDQAKHPFSLQNPLKTLQKMRLQSPGRHRECGWVDASIFILSGRGGQGKSGEGSWVRAESCAGNFLHAGEGAPREWLRVLLLGAWVTGLRAEPAAGEAGSGPGVP